MHTKIKCVDVLQQARRVALFMRCISCVLTYFILVCDIEAFFIFKEKKCYLEIDDHKMLK